MPELIYKQASMKAICDGCFQSRAVDIELKCRGTCNVIDILQQQPTVEAKPVKHGRWIPLSGWCNRDFVKCSECGNTLDMNGVNAGRGDANFCPNCGSKNKED